MKKIIGLVICLILGSACFGMGTFTSENKDIQKAIDVHNNSRFGDFSKIDEAVTLLKPYTEKDSIACAYYGSLLTLQAAVCVEKNPIQALDYLTDGSKYLDKAVNMDCENAMLHLFRLENGIEVSRTSPVKRYEVISEDIDFLLSCDMSDFDSEIVAEIYLYCGYYKLDAGELDEAFDYFDEAVNVAPDSDVGKLAEKTIEKYSE